MRGGMLQEYYHSKMLHGGTLNQPTYENELYDLVQYVERWKHYMMFKYTIIHIDLQHCSIRKPKVTFNKPNTSSGWVF